MSYATGTRSVGQLVASPARRMARIVPGTKSVLSGLGRFPRSTMRQSGPIGGAMPSVDRIQTGRFRPTPDGPQPG